MFFEMNYLDIYKLLNKSNCGECDTPTCMAFALSVIKGERDPVDCPYIDKEVASKIAQSVERKDWKVDLIQSLRKEVTGIEFNAVADGLGAQIIDNKLNVKCLGMDFRIDTTGKVHTTGHINPWIEILLLHYVRTAGSSALTGKWVSFSELRGGLVKVHSFKRDCEEPLKAIVDDNGEYFSDLLGVLGGKHVEDQPADKAWVIYPLPKVPFLILYWKADDDYSSSLNILMDRTADEYLDVESVIFLGEGLVEMFRRIIAKHG
jgi:hypothetical protein